jgi:hypothetical protein
MDAPNSESRCFRDLGYVDAQHDTSPQLAESMYNLEPSLRIKTKCTQTNASAFVMHFLNVRHPS